MGLIFCFWACASELGYSESYAGGDGSPGGRDSSTGGDVGSGGRSGETGGDGGTSDEQPSTAGAAGATGADSASGAGGGDSTRGGQAGSTGGASSVGDAGDAGGDPGGQSGQGGTRGSESCLQDSVIHVTSNGHIAYTLRIDDAMVSEDNPTLRLCRGNTYVFELAVTGHPFYIKTARTLGDTDAYPVFNNGAQQGEVTIGVSATAPDRLYYQCGVDAAMGGTLEITN